MKFEFNDDELKMLSQALDYTVGASLPVEMQALINSIKKEVIFNEEVDKYYKENPPPEDDTEIVLGGEKISLEDIGNDYLQMLKDRKAKENKIIAEFMPEDFEAEFDFANKYHVDGEDAAYQAQGNVQKLAYPKRMNELIKDLDNIFTAAEHKKLIESFDETVDLFNAVNNRHETELHFPAIYYLFYVNGKILVMSFTNGQGTLVCIDKWPIKNKLCKIYAERYAVNLKTLLEQLRSNDNT